MFLNPCAHKCDGTGWIRVDPEAGGYTGGISVLETKVVNETRFVKDPHTGEWKTFPDEDPTK